MRDRGRRTLPSLFRHRLFLLFNILLLLFFAFSFGREYMRNRQIQATIMELEGRARDLEQRNVEIAGINAQLESESFLEQEARLRLGLVKPGERVVVVSETPSEKVNIGGEEISGDIVEDLPQTMSARWQAYFFDTETFDRLKLLERPRL